jgi:hypothetical protein
MNNRIFISQEVVKNNENKKRNGGDSQMINSEI